MNSISSVKHRHHLDLNRDFHELKTKIADFASKNIVLVIAATLAIASCFIVTPDSKYIEYFDFNILSKNENDRHRPVFVWFDYLNRDPLTYKSRNLEVEL
jgi:hypothetical protein